MSTELEKDINEIKISVARIEERLKMFEHHMISMTEHDQRLRSLEDYKSKIMGICTALGAIAGTVAAIIVKLLP